MVHLIGIPVTLLVGGLLTSYAEYKFQYNLIDKIKDVFGFAKKAEAEASAAKAVIAAAVSDVKKI